MMLQRGVDVFPETKGLPIFCHSCKGLHYAEETISVSYTREKAEGEGQEIVQFLVCYSCATTRPDCVGSA